jgi:hypothetical protein
MRLLAKSVSLFAVGSCSLLPLDSRAATIREIVEHDRSYIEVEGTISKGDLDRIIRFSRSFVDQRKPIRLLVNSNGGDAVEAMKIGRFVRSSLAQVAIEGSLVKPNSFILRQCYSACVLILVGGAMRDHLGDNMFVTEDGSIVWDEVDGHRVHKSIPVIGIHRSYFDAEVYNHLTPDEARTEYARLEGLVREYLREMGAPNSLADQMFRYASDEIHLLSKGEFVGIVGFEEPFLEEWFLAKCGALDRTEMSDYAKVLAGRIQRKSKSYIPDQLSGGYVDYLEEKYTQVMLCKNNQILDHQRSVLVRFEVK